MGEGSQEPGKEGGWERDQTPGQGPDTQVLEAGGPLGDDGSPSRTRREDGLLSTRVTPDASSTLQHRKLQMGKAGLVEGTLSLLSQPKQGASKQALLLTDCVNLAAVSLPTLEGTAVDSL